MPQSMGLKESDTTERLNSNRMPTVYLLTVHISLHKITRITIWYYAPHNKPKQI